MPLVAPVAMLVTPLSGRRDILIILLEAKAPLLPQKMYSNSVFRHQNLADLSYFATYCGFPKAIDLLLLLRR